MRLTRLVLLAGIVAVPSQATADWNDYDYSEERQLGLDAAGISHLEIDAGAGSLDIRGVAGANAIDVMATILVDGADEKSAPKFIENNMRLSLEQKGDRAVLIADFRDAMSFGKSGAIALKITVPTGTDLTIDDGSGSTKIRDTEGNLKLDDGSGSIAVRNVLDVDVDDGSGSTEIIDVRGNVRINDGSGSITIRDVTGDVWVDDGSGSINIARVQGDFTVVDAGSGSVNYEEVMGRIDIAD